MSGPKVVRIVTRDEIIAICEDHLRRLDQAIATWIHDSKRINELTEIEIAATLDRKNALVALLAQDSFVELQKQIPDEISFLSADRLRRQKIATGKIAQELKRQRQGRDIATTLLRKLQAEGTKIPEELYSDLHSIAAGAKSPDVDTILARALSIINPPKTTDLTDTQRTAINLLQAGVETESSTWQSAHIPATSNPRIERVEHQISELGLLLQAQQITDFLARLDIIEKMGMSSQQNLHLDSLILDLGSALEIAREQQSALEELNLIAANLRFYDPNEALLKRINTCTALTPLAVIVELLNNSKVVITQLQQQREAEARRKVILQGLAQLGYEVNEGMETAWARDGQVVAKKSSLPGYGIEIGGQAQSGRLQVRSVAFSADRDIKRDTDVETIWCGEFSRLQEILAEHGDNLLIERALGVGAVPLKVVSETWQSDMQEVGRHIGAKTN